MKMSVESMAVQSGRSQYADHRTPLIQRAWYVAARSSEVSRTLMDRRILGQSILFYRTEDGRAVALDNRCLHRSFPLSKGYLEGDNVVCGYHGLTYDPCGTCVRIPSLNHTPKSIQTRRYPLVERDSL